MDYQEKARRVIQLEIDELQRLHDRIDGSFGKAVQALQQALTQGGKIIIVGVGKSGNICHKLAATLNSTGATATVLNCQDALHGDLGLVDEGDAIIAFSYSGETRELLDILPHLKRLRITLISITGQPKSTLASVGDISLDVHVEREACPLNLAPTSSTTNMLVLGDALAMTLLEARGFKKEDFAELHPGGSLGRTLLTKASDIMRSGDDIAILGAQETIQCALEKMTATRTGAVIITGDDQQVIGIFTQGDFTRAFQTQNDLAKGKVGDYMTVNPISIPADKLAAEVLALLEDHRIDDLVVVDSNNRPLGLIDIQDLTRLHIL
ncbi:MAG: KpsF/GutQ family sugar-phosphate isomerase [Verrucomicrobiales bacterium]|nr:KpsF/GutQ family sugar-phosphate isomerase [Verrucomicrobiales bacterium]